MKSDNFLTIQELKEATGHSVWVQAPNVPETGRWETIGKYDEKENGFPVSSGFLNCAYMGKIWLAYSDAPKEDVVGPMTLDEVKEHISIRHPHEIEPLYVTFDPPIPLDFAPRWRDAYSLSQLVASSAESYGKTWWAYRYAPNKVNQEKQTHVSDYCLFSGFTVIDNETGIYPDCDKIIESEEWAEPLRHCGFDHFAMTEDGTLHLLGADGDLVDPPADRFKVLFKQSKGSERLSRYELQDMDGEPVWDDHLKAWGLVVGDSVLYRNGEKLPIFGNGYRSAKMNSQQRAGTGFLSLDELRQMTGKPVWVKECNHILEDGAAWCIVEEVENLVTFLVSRGEVRYGRFVADNKDYGKTWWAYKGEQNNNITHKHK